jgi:dihydroorotase
MTRAYDTVLKGGRVIDPAQGINAVSDVAIKDGRIAAIGKELAADGAEAVDIAGLIVTPGLIDIHVHVYGMLGFAWPDRVGITQGVTTYVEPGGPGVATYGEYVALIQGTTIANLYCGIYLGQIGISGFEVVDGDIRTMVGIPINQWIDVVDANRDTIRYLKVGAFSNYGGGLLKMAKGLAEVLELPLYVHIGDLMITDVKKSFHPEVTPLAFKTAEKGDIITHIYQANPGNILAPDGRVIPEVYDAERRGVLFDVGFGAYNFSFDVAEKALAQDVVPPIISSDLQQVNVTGPTYSLANVMSVFLSLGLTPEQIIERVTINPARALSFADRHGTLQVGRAADVTVLRIEQGEFEFADTQGNRRSGDRRFMPVMVFKDGRRHAIDMELAQEVENWAMQIATDHVPAAAASLSSLQKEFLRALSQTIGSVDWEAKEFNSNTADAETGLEIHRRFHATQKAVGLPAREALRALFACLFDQPFTYQAAAAISHQPKSFIIERLTTVSNGEARVAAEIGR